MTPEEYRAAPGLNFSLAKHLLRSGAHFRAAVEAPEAPTHEMEIGTMLHAWVLEDKPPRYIVKPDGMKLSTKDGITFKAEAEADDRTILAYDEAAMLVRILANLADNRTIQNAFRGCQKRELPLFADFDGVAIKGLIDMLGEDATGAATLLDFKTANDASDHGFGTAVATYHYLMQAAWYSALVSLHLALEQPPRFAWIVAETSAAGVCRLIQPTPEQMGLGDRQMERCIRRFKECQERNVWPGYSNGGVSTLRLPAWAYREEEDAI